MTTLRTPDTQPDDTGNHGDESTGGWVAVVAHSPVVSVIGTRVPIDKQAVIERVEERGQQDRRMSRYHATLTIQRGELVLRDGAAEDGSWKRSANGTWIGSNAIDEQALVSSDWFRTGRTIWVVLQHPAPQDSESLLEGITASIGAVRAEVGIVVRQAARRLAEGRPVTQSLLVTGQRGTGKQIVAREARRLLEQTLGRSVPFVHFAGPALTDSMAAADLFGVSEGYATGVKARPGVFEQAHGGVLLIDEVADTPIAEQAKLLAVLQEREVTRLGASRGQTFDALVISATNRTLPSPNFRADLSDRLSRFRVHLPPLTARRADIPFIFQSLLARHGPTLQLHYKALALLMDHPWPGNVRELDATAERVAAYAEADGQVEVTRSHVERALQHTTEAAISDEPPSDSPQAHRRTNPPREELLALLESAGWNKSAVARHYGTTPRQIRRWMAYLNIDA